MKNKTKNIYNITYYIFKRDFITYKIQIKKHLYYYK